MSLKKKLLLGGSIILLVVIILLLNFSIFTKGKNDNGIAQLSEINTQEISQPLEEDNSEEDQKPDISTYFELQTENESKIEDILEKGKVITPAPTQTEKATIPDLSRFMKKEKNVPVNNSNLDELLVMQKDISAFSQSLQEIKSTLIKSENELSDLRVQNAQEIRQYLIRENLHSLAQTAEEVIAIEETQKKLINHILGDTTFEASVYKVQVEDKIKNFANLSDSEVTNFINAHKNKMLSLENASQREIEDDIADGVSHAKIIQSNLDVAINLATQYVSIQNQLDNFKTSGSQIVANTNNKLQSIYNSIPSYTPQNTTGSSNCISVKDKYALVAGKGWVKMKECTNGTYIEADRYVPYQVNQTPQQLCDQRKAAALSGYFGGAVDCSDLGI